MRLISRALLFAALPLSMSAQRVPAPSEALGLNVGADRVLADYAQIRRYFETLAQASPAVHLDTMGLSSEGRPFIVATISSPANIRNLAKIRADQALLADPRKLSPAVEAQLVAEQPTVLVVSCNIHATEIGASQMAMELAWRLATVDTLQRRLEHVVVLLVPSMNPDGQQMVTDWYKQGLGGKWEGGPLPWIYHKYVGHDNNRDWYMVTQKETRAVTDLLYRQWFPEIFYDVHQQGNEGTRLALPPMVDPLNPNIDPIIVRGISQIGVTMSFALESHGKSGAGDGVTYDMWWHGGARGTPTRHNMIGLLTEAASVKVATPITQKLADLKGHPRGLPKYEARVQFPNPWPGGTWRLRDIMDYELIAAEALIKLAADQREQYIRNFVQVARNQMKLGATQAPYAYRIPYAQRDPMATEKLLEVLRVGGVEITRGTDAWLVPMAQPYRAHAKDLLEVQRFPKLEKYPGGPPERPYDVAGWTLPLQMGVKVDAVNSPDVETGVRVEELSPTAVRDCQKAPGGGRGTRWWSLPASDLESYRGVWKALARGTPVTVASSPSAATVGARPGTFYVQGNAQSAAGLAPRGCGHPIAAAPPANGRVITRAPRVALYRSYTANMDEGWTRWLFEQMGIPFASVSDSLVRAGRLRDQFDVLIVPDMNLREARDGSPASQVPPQYAGGLGAGGLAELRQFTERGGTLVLLDHASEIGTAVLGVPVRLIQVGARNENEGDLAARTRARDEATGGLFAPGSILRMLPDGQHPVNCGMADTAGVYFTNSVTFDVAPDAKVQVLARYPADTSAILMSGFLQGAREIAGKAAAVEVVVGQNGGRVVMFGFRAQYRGQSYGTFRMLFNAMLEGAPGMERR
jgi:hypothetical protein